MQTFQPTLRIHYFYDRTIITSNICKNLGKQENKFLSGLIMQKRALTIIEYTFVREWFWLNLIASLQLQKQKYMTTRKFSDYHVAHKKS